MTSSGSMKRMSMVVAVLMIVAVVVGCAKKDTNAGESSSSPTTSSPPASSQAPSESASQPSNDSKANLGLPIVNETITLKGFAPKSSVHADWSQMPVFQQFEKDSNIKIEWENVGDNVYRERLNLKFASNDLPDFIARGGLSNAELEKFAKQGSIIDLTPLIEQYAPNLMKVFEEDPSKRSAITFPDGKIYALPLYYSPEFGRVHIPWINQEILNELGLPMPTTADEYYDALAAFKAKYPDRIGLSDFSSTMDRYVLNFSSLWGLGSGGSLFGYGLDVGDDGNLRFAKTDPRFKEVLQYLNKMWVNGLMDPESFTHKPEDWFAKLGSNKVFSYLQTASAFSGEHVKQFVPVPPLTGPYGDKEWNGLNTSVRAGNMVITSVNKYPEATMVWFDYWFSDEGYVKQVFGIEGETYKINPDGTYEYIIPQENRGQMSPYYGDGIPVNEPVDAFEKYPLARTDATYGDDAGKDAIKLYKDALPKGDVNMFALTEDENEKIKDFRSEVLTYIREMEAQFITGKVSFDKWDSFVKEIEGMGLAQYMEVMDGAYKRYKGQ